MGHQRKLPEPRELERLYWMENLTTTQIAKRYHCHRDTVLQGLKRAGIPLKQRRIPAQCKVCGETVCLIKVWNLKRRGYEWRPASWCATHYVEERRRWMRESARRKRGSTRRNQRRRPLPPFISPDWIRDWWE